MGREVIEFDRGHVTEASPGHVHGRMSPFCLLFSVMVVKLNSKLCRRGPLGLTLAWHVVQFDSVRQTALGS